MRAIILAAGLGTRLQPMTHFFPKPLLPVAGVPNIARIIHHLKRSGIDDIAINLHHLPRAIPDALGDGAQWNVRLRYYPETDLLGTGGGIRRMMDDAPNAPHIVINGDVLFAPNLDAIIAFHDAHGALATMVVRPSDDAEKLGAVATTPAGRVGRLVYAGDRALRPLHMFTGVHVLSADIRPHLPAQGCIVRQTYIPMVQSGDPLFACPSSAWFCDLGTPKDYLDTNVALLRGHISLPHYTPPPNQHFIHGEARVNGAPHIGRGVSIGERAHIEGPVHIENAVILEGAHVSRDIRNAIVCPDGTAITP
ncbi:MAG: NDP-sugar synthase [Proteobacteria bacterium]|nr:NDP-sugar synthase [Pseudomonadota bacterium]